MPPKQSVLLRAFHVAIVAAVCATSALPATARTLEVPSAYATIQAAINAATQGDVVLIAPGIHTGRPVIVGKEITLASRYLTTGDRAYIDQTIIDGTAGGWALRIQPGAGAPAIVGLTFRNADDGIRATGRFRFIDNRVTATGDGIDYEDGSGGLVSGCLFEGNSDDGIDVDNAVNAQIVGNTIRDNGDDGIEIRLQGYTGPRLTVVIRDNTISGNGEDGIQLISYNLGTPRTIHIEGNLILNNAMAGLGMMCCENTIENYQGADLKEPVGLYQNTFVGNNHGVIGGDSLIAVNNLFVGTANVALKRAQAGSVTGHNLFFGNGTDHALSNVDEATTLYADPILKSDYGLALHSPAIDAGCPFFNAHGRLVWRRAPGDFSGTSPDLGAIESPAGLGVDDHPARGGLALLPPAPHPSHGPTMLRIVLPITGRVRLDVLDVAGRNVRRLRDEVTAAGRHEFAWDGRGTDGRLLPAGAYFARLECATHVRTRGFVRLD